MRLCLTDSRQSGGVGVGMCGRAYDRLLATDVHACICVCVCVTDFWQMVEIHFFPKFES